MFPVDPIHRRFRLIRSVGVFGCRIRTEAVVLLVRRQVAPLRESFVAAGADEVALVGVDQLVVTDVNVSVRSSDQEKKNYNFYQHVFDLIKNSFDQEKLKC